MPPRPSILRSPYDRAGARLRVARAVLAAALAAAAVAAPPAPAHAPAWSGDFETGDLGQWDGLDGDPSREHFQLVTPPPGGPPGQYALQTTVDASALGQDESGQRSLVYLYPSADPGENRSWAFDGSDAWYHTALYFPADFVPSPDTEFNWVVEWHNWPDTACCANLALTVDTATVRGGGERLTLKTMGGGSPASPVERVPVYNGKNPTGTIHYYVG